MANVEILIAAGLATTGWLYAARRARALARKQHTVTVIMQTNSSERFLSARENMSPHLTACKFPEDVLQGKNEELKKNFRDILNHYEFVSAGLRNGDFDEQLVRDCERGTYIALYKCCEKYVWTLRNGRQRMTIYEHLEWVHDRWSGPQLPWHIRAIELVRGRPMYGHRKNSK